MTDRAALRAQYLILLNFIRSQRARMASTLAEPGRSRAVTEADNAIVALLAVGEALGDLLAEPPAPTQAPLLHDTPKGDYGA